jgi:hypothetical protein
MPKSMMIAGPSVSSMTFSGFRSRWTTPDDAGGVRRAQTFGNIAGNRQRFRDRQRPPLAQPRRQAGPGNEGHGDVLDAAHLAQIVNAHDVTMGHLPRQQQLAFEAALDVARRLRVRHDFRTDDFQRDRDAQFFVPGLVDDAHAARPEHAENAVAQAERLAGSKRTGRPTDAHPSDPRRLVAGGRGGEPDPRRLVAHGSIAEP